MNSNIIHNTKTLNNVSKFSISSVNRSKIEKRVDKALKQLGMKFSCNDFICGKEVDFVVSDKVVIEVQGNRAHANPKYYKWNSVMNARRKVIAQDIWLRDYRKKMMLLNMGYEVIYIWEDDIKNRGNPDLKKFVHDSIKRFL